MTMASTSYFTAVGVQTGSADVGQRITVTYPEDGMERVVSDDQKNKLYLKPDEFSKKIYRPAKCKAIVRMNFLK